MAKKVIGNNNFNPDLVGNQFTSPNSSSLFTLGNFKIETNITQRVIKNYSTTLTTFTEPLTLETLKIKDVEEAKNFSLMSETLNLNFDKGNLNNYAYFGSLYELLRVTVENIITKWLGSLLISNNVGGGLVNTVMDFNYNPITNKSKFKIPAISIKNDFGLSFTTTNTDFDNENKIKNLNNNYNSYEIYFNSTANTYNIIGFTGASKLDGGYVYLEVDGNPFPEIITPITFLSKSYHVKPKDVEFRKWYSKLGDLEKYILNLSSTPKFTSTYKIPKENNDGIKYFITETLTWSTSDGYNIDYDGLLYDEFLTKLLEIGVEYDKFKTDLVLRMLVPESIIMFDSTNDEKITKLLRVYGREIDEIKKFIDGLSYVNNVTYDKKDNVSDTLVKRLAKTLGWNTFTILEETDFLDSLLEVNKDSESNLTPGEIDIELWRRILLNTNFFLKSKGTRKAIEVLFSFLGAPDELINLNEHIYLVSGKINISEVDINSLGDLQFSLETLPYDEKGYPVAPIENSDVYFQVSGNTDYGQTYINLYRNLGFDVTRINDNKKTWLKIEPTDLLSGRTGFDEEKIEWSSINYSLWSNYNNKVSLSSTEQIDFYNNYIEDIIKLFKKHDLYPGGDEFLINKDIIAYELGIINELPDDRLVYREDVISKTGYNLKDSNLIINTKEVGLTLDITRAIENDIYNYNKLNNFPVSSTGRTSPYPQRASNNFDANDLTFNEYIEKIYSRFINAQNNKTLSDETNSGYPSLKKLYEDYLNASNSKKLTYTKLLNYINNLESFWGKLIEQVIPATVVYEGRNSSVFRNSVFVPQKFVYKRGIDEGSEFRNKQQSQNDNIGNINILEIKGKVLTQIKDSLTLYETNGSFSFSYGNTIDTDEYTKLTPTLTFNINYESYIFTYDTPQFTILNSSKITTGMTYSDVIYELNNNTGKDLTFNFTGNTESLTGNNTNFIYKVYKFDTAISGFSETPIYSKVFDNNTFITGATAITDTIDNIFLERDSEYLIKGYFEVTANTLTANTLTYDSPYNLYEDFSVNKYSGSNYQNNATYYFDNNKYSGYTGQSISTENITNTGLYNIYDPTLDYYFIAVVDPSKPILNNLTNLDETFDETILFTETINFFTEPITTFELSYIPLGDIIVSYNGLTLQPNIDYNSFNPNILSNVVYEFSEQQYPITNSDIVTVSYLTNGNKINLQTENYVISGITSGTTPTTADTVYFRTDINKYTYYLEYSANSENDLIVYLNGIKLAPSNTLDYYLSTINKKEIIFNGVIESGDSINIYYINRTETDETIFGITGNPYTFNWSISNAPDYEGEFIFELTESGDTTFSAITFSASTTYIPQQYNYSLSVNFIDEGLTLGAVYRIRVNNRYNYITKTNNEIFMLGSISDSFLIKLPE
jgi:hypothetical protein